MLVLPVRLIPTSSRQPPFFGDVGRCVRNILASQVMLIHGKINRKEGICL